MSRTSVALAESTMKEVDSKAKEKGLTRSDYIAAAVESALHGTESDPNQMKDLENQIAEKDKTINSASKDLNQAKLDLNQAQLELMRSQRSVSKLENQIAEKDKEHAQSIFMKLIIYWYKYYYIEAGR